MDDFRKYAKSRYKALFKKLGAFRKKEKKELLHDIRVEIKKIKSLLLATEYCVNGFKAHPNFVSIRSIFRRAGEIRDRQVSHTLLSKFKLVVASQNDESTHQLILDFIQDIPGFKVIVEEGWRAAKNEFSRVKKKALKEHLNELSLQIKGQLFPKVNLKSIHKIRKLIKQLLYLSAISPLSKSRSHFFQELSEDIGDLHDRQTLLKNLKSKKNKTDNLLIRKINSECAVLAQEIGRRSIAFYSR
ncbi:MAG TPA: hypothetical protein DGG95_07945 [Cytophagales bacterium]|jgi:CHAD domain-containing protein|nr:hypothetical protein [Cytophagales bacterium]